MKTAIESVTAQGRPLFCLFVDLAKAYDSVPRHKLWAYLSKAFSSHDPQLTSAIASLYLDLCARLAEDFKGKFASIPVRAGVKQGCPMSPLLFSFYFDRVYEFVAQHL